MATGLFDEFSGYESPGRAIPLDRVREDSSALQRVVKGCEAYLETVKAQESWDRRHEVAASMATGLQVKGGDITLFCLELDRFEGHERFWGVGCYISALINMTEDEEVVLLLGGLGEKVQEIGYRLEGKTLVVEGDCGSYVGKEMRSGRIIVKGSVRFGTGDGMTGGEIRITGNIEGFGTVKGGDIYRGNKRVDPKATTATYDFDRTSFRSYFKDKPLPYGRKRQEGGQPGSR